MSLFSLTTISADVSFGAPMPNQGLESKPGRTSATVGISGKSAERVVVVTASGRNLPALMYSMDATTFSNITCTRPVSRSATAGAVPR